MRKLDWEDCIKALVLIAESPNAKKGYRDLKSYYDQNQMHKETEVVDFLIKEKFNDHDPNIN